MPNAITRPVRKAVSLSFEGTAYPLYEDLTGWRMRSRSIHHPVDFSTGTRNLTLAKRKAREHLERLKKESAPRTTTTLQDLVDAYKSLPKRASQKTAEYNAMMLRAVVKVTMGRSLKSVRLHEMTAELWQTYMAARQGREVVDLASRRPEHVSINTAVRCARSLFLESLRAEYAKRGIILPPPFEIPWLRTVKQSPAGYDDEALLAAWRTTTGNVWWCVALARFAGLRRAEIAAFRPGWVMERRGVWVVCVRDRPEENYYCKTGNERFSPITSEALVSAVRLLAAENKLVLTRRHGATGHELVERQPQKWLRQFMGAQIKKPLHRLRAAYLESIQEMTVMRLQRAGAEAAASAGGHTTTRTTEDHYLPAQLAG